MNLLNMETIDTLETKARVMYERVLVKRKEGREGLLEYIPVDPNEVEALDWAALHRSSLRNMYECSECGGGSITCRHNPFMNGTIRYVPPAPKTEVVALTTDGKTVVKHKNPTGKRGKPRTTLTLTSELVVQAIAKHRAGVGMVAIATEMNLQPAELSAAFKDAGIVLKKGKPKVKAKA